MDYDMIKADQIRKNVLDQFVLSLGGIGKVNLKLDNLSRRPIKSQGFTHVRVNGFLELKRSNGGLILATTHVESVTNPKGYDPELLRRTIPSAYHVVLNGANDYVPGKRVTLYSYPNFTNPDVPLTGWSFHCKLD